LKLEKVLNDFYLKNGIAKNGGITYDTFQVKIWFINITLPNPKFRKDVIHIHDLEHVLNNCDTSWKGEAFISGWEIGTGFWKYFPINTFIFLTFGLTLWLYPKSVFKGFKKALNNHGLINLGLSKSDFMKMELDRLIEITKKEQHTEMGILQWIEFIFWSFFCQIILLSPLILGILGLIFYFK